MDQVRGTSLLVEHYEEIPPAEVVSALQAAADAAPPETDNEAEPGSGGAGASVGAGLASPPPPGAGARTAGAAAGKAGTAGGAVGRRGWRLRLHTYLDWLFQREQAAGADFASLQARVKEHRWLLLGY